MALTIWQWWATMIALKEKIYETRHWDHVYRGKLVIHSGTHTEDLNKLVGHLRALTANNRAPAYGTPVHFINQILLNRSDEFTGKVTKDFPLGCGLAVAEVENIFQMTPEFIAGLSEQERAFGYFSTDRFAWQLKITDVFDKPIPRQGQSGLWVWGYE